MNSRFTYTLQSFLIIFTLMLVVYCCKQQEKPKQVALTTESTDYTLVWSDEFDYVGKPDPTKWSFEKGFKRNLESQYYTDSLRNARVEDGYLILEAHKEVVPNEAFIMNDHNNWKKNRKFAKYTAPSLTTQDLAEFKYGKIEVRATLPRGEGLWPAIWMLGENHDKIGWPYSGSINIMEHVGYKTDSIFGSVQTEDYNYFAGNEKLENVAIEKPYSKFHVYAIEWTPEKIDFFLDDNKYYTFQKQGNSKAEWPFDQKFYLKINIAVGGTLGGIEGVEEDVFPQQMIVDYVRVYQDQNLW